MVLTAVGKFEIMNPLANKFEPTTLLPDRYFRCALLIVDTLLDHLEVVFTRLQKTAVISKLNYKQQSLYASLPDAFTWQDFVQVAEELGIQYEATQKYRKDFIKYKLIMSQSHGHYKKVK